MSSLAILYLSGYRPSVLRPNHVARKKPIWKYVESVWFTHAEYAKRAVQFMTEAKQGKLHISALVEDGMLEKNIMFPVALYSEIMWNLSKDGLFGINFKPDLF